MRDTFMHDIVAATPARRFLLAAASFALALVALAPAARAQVWNEVGDAGGLVGSAQLTVGTGGLATINGNLATPADVDVYCIHLSAVPPAGLPLLWLNCVVIFGPHVWLFDATGKGVSTNLTCAGSNKTILAPNGSLALGNYYVAVCHDGLEPQSAGGPIWLPAILGQRSPDGPGAALPLTAWTGTPNVQPINPYTLGFNSNFIGFCDAATPARLPSWGSLKIHY
jgi:hypothetical protein